MMTFVNIRMHYCCVCLPCTCLRTLSMNATIPSRYRAHTNGPNEPSQKPRACVQIMVYYASCSRTRLETKRPGVRIRQPRSQGRSNNTSGRCDRSLAAAFPEGKRTQSKIVAASSESRDSGLSRAASGRRTIAIQPSNL